MADITKRTYDRAANSSLFVKIKDLIGNGKSKGLDKYVKLDSMSYHLVIDTIPGSKQATKPRISGGLIQITFTAYTNVAKLVQYFDKAQQLGEVEILEVDSDRDGFNELKKFVLKSGADGNNVNYQPHIKSLVIKPTSKGRFRVTAELQAAIIEATLCKQKDDGQIERLGVQKHSAIDDSVSG